MKIAITTWENRVSPVCDTSRKIRIYEVSGKKLNSYTEDIDINAPLLKARRIKELGIEVLICGAITKSMESEISSFGISVIPFICGNVDEIINIYIKNRRLSKKYTMPGYKK